MPSHTKTEQDKNKRRAKAKPKKAPKKVKKAKKVNRAATFAERLGWTTNTEDISLRGNLQPACEEE